MSAELQTDFLLSGRVSMCLAIVSYCLDLSSRGVRRDTRAHLGQLKLHVQVHYDMTRCLMGAPLYYLTLT